MSLQALIDVALAETPPGRGVWVGLSGGLDSSLLLTLAAEACRRHPRPLRALHVHHGLQAAADDFEAQCRRVCSRLGVPLYVVRVNVDRESGLGLEGAAREARYAALARRVGEGETLWLAQHRDDQAETFLLAALRGSGVRGLAGMPSRRDWQGRYLVRPLLGVSRRTLEAEAARYGLDWCEDPSNVDTTLDRNFLRRQVLPLLTMRWPRAGEALAQSAALAGDAEVLLEALAEEDLARLSTSPDSLPVAGLVALDVARRRLLVRHACRRSGLPAPPARRLETLLDQLRARPDAEVALAWPGAEARVWRGRLYLMAPVVPLSVDWEAEWDGALPLATPTGSLVGGLAHETGPVERLTVRPRRGGEALRLARRGRRDLKRLLQEAGVPPWRRGRLLVVHHDETVVAVFDPAIRDWVAVAEGWSGRGQG